VTEFFTFVVAGITVGSVFALVAVGLVLTFRTSGVLNFAHGALAIVAVEAYIYFTVSLKLSWEVGAALAVVGVGCASGLLLEPLGRVLARVAPAHQVVATIGLLIAIQSGAVLVGPRLPGGHPRFLAPPFPGGTVSIAGVNVGEDQIIIMVVSIIVGGGLWLFLSRSRMGLSMRAVVTNPELLDLCGTSPVRVRRGAWMIGSVFACLSGVVLALAPTFGPSPEIVNMVILPSFAGAAIAGFTRLPLAYAGGLIVGIVSSLLTRYVTVDWLTGLSATAPYLILFVALVAISWRRVGSSTARVAPRPGYRFRTLASPWVHLVAGSALLIAVISVPAWSGFDVDFYTTTLVFVVLFLSLGLLMKTGGMVSLCQLGFAAVGATAFGQLASQVHLPWFLALALAMLAAAAVGAVVALPVLRLSGAYLGLATVAFGFILEQLVYPTSLMFGSSGGSLTAPRPVFAASDDAYYYVVVGGVVVTAVAVFVITRSRLGRLLRGLADAPLALQAQGASVNVTRLLTFVASAALAGLAGALLGGLNDFVTPTAFSAQDSLTLVAVLFVVRLGDPWYAFAAAGAYYLLPAKLPVLQASTWTSVAFGVLAVYTVLAGARGRAVRQPWRAGRVVPERAPVVATASPRTSSPAPPPRVGAHGVLEVVDLTVRFGGLTALDGVSLRVRPDAITGLIGPNGAGKTTLLNACSGLVRPATGRVVLDGRAITDLGMPGRARRGLGRTFQHVELFESMSVRETVALGREAALAGANPLRHVIAVSTTRASSGPVEEAIELCGLTPIADRTVSTLSTASRRLVELARCLSWPFSVLLLDEPTAGLDRTESQRLGEVMERVVSARGIGILIVEHDVSLVMSLCAHVAVLDFGRLLFEGEPAAVMASETVRAAYLGNSTGSNISKRSFIRGGGT
jgi:ABC-type branched-subunit amino acid transport system ATPase component/branched-subunit amino acid ABC-type transport system permease component